jgi:hypothetical protein
MLLEGEGKAGTSYIYNYETIASIVPPNNLPM